MKTLCACLIVLLLGTCMSRGADPLFAELEEVYLTVLTDSVTIHETSDRVYAVAIGKSGGFRGTYIAMPDSMWDKLASRLKDKGINPSQLVSPKEIDWKDNKTFALIHKPTGKQAWVYSIDGVTWHGNNRLHVAQSVYNGGLAAGGCTLVLEKKGGKWVVVERTDHWVS